MELPAKRVRVHLCSDPCTAVVWDEGYTHAQELQEVERAAVGWSQNLEAAVPREEEDELRHLRAEVDRVRDRGKGVGSEVE